MASKEVKSLLKNARESIRNKEYKEALKHCKAVLKVDKTNYNALVFIGVCAKEMEQPDQAQAAYKRAIESDESQVLAWQGLSSLYEKETGNSKFQEDLPDVYKKLLKLYESSDKTKWREINSKLTNVYQQQGKTEEAIEMIKELIQISDDKQEIYDLNIKILTLLEKEKSNDEAILSKLVAILHTLVNEKWPSGSKSDSLAYHTKYIKTLLKIQENKTGEKREEDKLLILEECRKVSKAHPNTTYPLEVMGKIYLEDSIHLPDTDNQVPDVYQMLCHLDPSSAIGQIGLGWTLFKKNDFVDARGLLEQGLQSYPDCPVGWFYLIKVQLCVHDYKSAEKSAVKGIKYIGSVTNEVQRNHLNTLLRLKQAEALYKQGSLKATEARTILQEILLVNEEDPEVLTSMGETVLVLGDTKQATEYCNKVLEIDSTYHTAIALQGKISFADKLYDDAELRFLEAIELCSDRALYFFLLGKLYWEMNGDLRANKDKCLNQFLKAAKLDPFYSPTFLYLGHYYQEVQKDLSKACRCYQKAFDLDQQCDEAGSHLGDMLTQLGKETEALQLFTNVTRNAPPGEGKWAWIRLGLYHLKRNQNNEAISCFQSALRADPKDSHCWECLGEAYMSRGSFTAALKSFARAAELDTSSVYSLYQIATIKQMLCVYDEAIKEYQIILDKQPGYVPALKGFGETHLFLARESLAQDFNKRAVDHVTQGLTALARAVESSPNMSCLWKLIGDCCVVINPLPSCLISVKLPENLKLFLVEQDCVVSDKRELLSLATSAYTKALKSQPKCASLWNDLGYSYFLQAKIQGGDENKKLAERSVQVLKKGLTLQRTNHKLWNTLGVVCASDLVNNPELSQHSFIMSIKTESVNPVAWTNLGVLYLKHNKVEPAHEAFKKAQALDPSYTEAWVGQASIAEIIGSEEAADLFRHTLELGSHVEGSIGYAHWVCTYLTSGKVPQDHSPVASLSHLPEEYRRAVTQASVAMTKYTDRVRSSACAFNMHGLLLEHQRLFIQAEQAFASAVQLLKENSSGQDHLNVVYINRARVLCSLGRYSEAIETYQNVTPLTNFHVVCGLALAYYMAGKLPESYRAYDQALHLTTSDADKSCVLTAMGMIGYALNDVDGAKAMLFKSSQISPPCERGLMALCALGLVNDDLTLAGAALSELLKLDQKRKDVIYADICFLFSQFFAVQGNETVGLRHILKAIHEHPERSALWEQCATFIIDKSPDNLQVAMRCAEVTRKLKNIGEQMNESLHPTSLLGSGALPSRDEEQPMTTASQRTIGTLRAAQKALRAHPDRLESLAVLCAAVTAHGIAMDTEDKGRQFHLLALRLSQMTMSKCVEEEKILDSKAKAQLPNLLLSRSQELEGLQRWTVLHTGYSMMYCGLFKEAKQHCDQALSVYANDPQMKTALHFLEAQVSLCCDEVDEAVSLLQSSVLSSPYHSPIAWQVLAEVHISVGSPVEAELCYRKCLQAGANERSTNWRVVPLLRLALLALNQAKAESAERDRWFTLCQEASTEVIKIDPDCAVARLVQGISFYLQGSTRQSRRYLQNAAESKTSASTVAQHWLSIVQGGNK